MTDKAFTSVLSPSKQMASAGSQHRQVTKRISTDRGFSTQEQSEVAVFDVGEMVQPEPIRKLSLFAAAWRQSMKGSYVPRSH